MPLFKIEVSIEYMVDAPTLEVAAQRAVHTANNGMSGMRDASGLLVTWVSGQVRSTIRIGEPPYANPVDLYGYLVEIGDAEDASPENPALVEIPTPYDRWLADNQGNSVHPEVTRLQRGWRLGYREGHRHGQDEGGEGG